MVALARAGWESTDGATAADIAGVCDASAPAGATNGTIRTMVRNATNDAANDRLPVRSR
ncbi:unannotated protein [freshwater metagenome]|uniref:Unannotated protein n=1 Tax=freshwater metagenome TaxID=449393 RepID=A0A6J7KIT5_9ZZZZ